MSRGSRAAKRKKNLEARANSNNRKYSRGEIYGNMSKDGMLGNQELDKYSEMYCVLKQIVPNFDFPNIDNGRSPERSDYISLQRLYRKNIYC